jgi:hypothetical protein
MAHNTGPDVLQTGRGLRVDMPGLRKGVWIQMSIIIQNMGGPVDGVCKYQLRINQRVIVEFEHDRRDGLSACLNKAAEAAEQERVREVIWLAEKVGTFSLPSRPTWSIGEE